MEKEGWNLERLEKSCRKAQRQAGLLAGSQEPEEISRNGKIYAAKGKLFLHTRLMRKARREGSRSEILDRLLTQAAPHNSQCGLFPVQPLLNDTTDPRVEIAFMMQTREIRRL